mmetsp:Transcript_39785/g.112896  ORF Transcript_39785/g.112896 Transcript_39785/m.112896 type:complete len:377 (+) Transcript_39785:999-2129(+)
MSRIISISCSRAASFISSVVFALSRDALREEEVAFSSSSCFCRASMVFTELCTLIREAVCSSSCFCTDSSSDARVLTSSRRLSISSCRFCTSACSVSLLSWSSATFSTASVQLASSSAHRDSRGSILELSLRATSSSSATPASFRPLASSSSVSSSTFACVAARLSKASASSALAVSSSPPSSLHSPRNCSSCSRARSRSSMVASRAVEAMSSAAWVLTTASSVSVRFSRASASLFFVPSRSLRNTAWEALLSSSLDRVLLNSCVVADSVLKVSSSSLRVASSSLVVASKDRCNAASSARAFPRRDRSFLIVSSYSFTVFCMSCSMRAMAQLRSSTSLASSSQVWLLAASWSLVLSRSPRSTSARSLLLCRASTCF